MSLERLVQNVSRSARERQFTDALSAGYPCLPWISPAGNNTVSWLSSYHIWHDCSQFWEWFAATSHTVMRWGMKGYCKHPISAQFTVAGIGLSFLLCAALQSLKRRRIWWSCCPTHTSGSGMTECTNGRKSKARAATNHKSSSKMMRQCAQSTTITTSVPPPLALRDQPG